MRTFPKHTQDLMNKEENHEHLRVYSGVGIGNSAGDTSYWICKNCGFEGRDFTPRRNEYEEIKRKFNK